MLKKGENAPEFSDAGFDVRTVEGDDVSLASLTASGKLMLVFLRGFG